MYTASHGIQMDQMLIHSKGQKVTKSRKGVHRCTLGIGVCTGHLPESVGIILDRYYLGVAVHNLFLSPVGKTPLNSKSNLGRASLQSNQVK